MTRDGGIDWAMGELLAFGSLLLEQVPVRLAGQDSRRGTFVQRHAVLIDKETAEEWTPLLYLSDDQARFWVYDSLLSEYAAMGFEYGYSVERPDALVLWEAQFGDFANGAQSILDEFISSSEQKWGQHSSVVLLLPHGYEGQGPDHSSARIERYLQMCAEDNMTVAMPSTPASYFHLLRRQAFARPRRPLVVFTPKSMLRLKAAVELGRGPDHRHVRAGQARPVGHRPGPDRPRAAVQRQGLLRPGRRTGQDRRHPHGDRPARAAGPAAARGGPARRSVSSPTAELVWVQEEPANQGPWPFIALNLPDHLGGRTLRRISRPASASPATGSSKMHALEQQTLVEQAFAR